MDKQNARTENELFSSCYGCLTAYIWHKKIIYSKKKTIFSRMCCLLNSNPGSFVKLFLYNLDLKAIYVCVCWFLARICIETYKSISFLRKAVKKRNIIKIVSEMVLFKLEESTECSVNIFKIASIIFIFIFISVAISKKSHFMLSCVKVFFLKFLFEHGF